MSSIARVVRSRRAAAAGLALALAVVPALGAEEPAAPQPPPSEAVRLREAVVTVPAKVRCRQYEGTLLHCTADPSRAALERLGARLILGYVSVEIDGQVYETDRVGGGEARFRPHGPGREASPAGERELKLRVIYVE